MMLLSFANILLFGMFFGWICRLCKLPPLLGMMISGILLGPFCLDLLDDALLLFSADIRKAALLIILLRAGLSLNLHDLKQVGRPAFFMCFIPASIEILAMLLFAPMLLDVSFLDATIMGTVVAAVSPAVIVPKMLHLMETGYGVNQRIPQLLLAGASVDDVFVIVLFSAFTSMAQGASFSLQRLAQIPLAIGTGMLVGVCIGCVCAKVFKHKHIRDTSKVLILFCIACFLTSIEDHFGKMIPFSSLLAVMFMGILFLRQHKVAAQRLATKFNKLWIGAEILLFVLVGASVDITFVFHAGLPIIILLLLVFICRMLGVYACLWKSGLTKHERLFCMIAYMPKATVQAAIGGIPLSMGLACGNMVLTIAVLAILITAPLGAFLIDHTYKILLQPT